LTNIALASIGATASASSTYAGGGTYLPAGTINGDRSGANWGAGGGWNDNTPNAWPDWLEVDFGIAQSITEIDVFSVQDSFLSPTTPTSTMTFSLYGLVDFLVQYWDGSAWQTIPGGTVTGNTLVWRQFLF